MSQQLDDPDGRDGGFSLVEMLVVVVLLGIVGGVFTTSVIGALGTERRTSARADVQQSVTLSMDRLTKQVRVASPLHAISPTGLTLDTYRVSGGSETRSRYVYAIDTAAGTLTETVSLYSPPTAATPSSTASRVLARGLTSGSFAGYHRDGNATVDAAKVASVDVVLAGRAPDGPVHTARTTIYLRNYKG